MVTAGNRRTVQSPVPANLPGPFGSPGRSSPLFCLLHKSWSPGPPSLMSTKAVYRGQRTTYVHRRVHYFSPFFFVPFPPAYPARLALVAILGVPCTVHSACAPPSALHLSSVLGNGARCATCSSVPEYIAHHYQFDTRPRCLFGLLFLRYCQLQAPRSNMFKKIPSNGFSKSQTSHRMLMPVCQLP